MPARRRNGRPDCAGKLRNGSPCNNAAKPNSNLCGRCQYRQEHEHELFDPAPIHLEQQPEPAEDNRITADRFRAQLADDLAEDYDLAVATLKAAMTTSGKRGYATCPACKIRVPVDIPDNGARVRAVQTWTELSLGRVRETPTTNTATRGSHPHSLTIKELEALTDNELETLTAGEWPTETAAQQITATATTHPDGTATIPAQEWAAFLQARQTWDTTLAAR